MKDIDRTKEINISLYEELLITLKGTFWFDTEKGRFTVPAHSSRANAWICAYCGKTPYTDPFFTKAEMSTETVQDNEEDLQGDEVPLIMFIDSNEDGETDSEVTLHFKCAQEIGLMDMLIPGAPVIKNEHCPDCEEPITRENPWVEQDKLCSLCYNYEDQPGEDEEDEIMSGG